MTIYAIHDPKGKRREAICFVRDAKDARDALRITRACGITLSSAATAHRISLDDYARQFCGSEIRTAGTTPDLPTQ
jgi:hypothetical protein